MGFGNWGRYQNGIYLFFKQSKNATIVARCHVKECYTCFAVPCERMQQLRHGAMWGRYQNGIYFLASQDAQEVMYVSQWVSQSRTDRDFTDVTLVSDDTNYFTWFTCFTWFNCFTWFTCFRITLFRMVIYIIRAKTFRTRKNFPGSNATLLPGFLGLWTAPIQHPYKCPSLLIWRSRRWAGGERKYGQTFPLPCTLI